MNPRIISRIYSIILLGILLGLMVHQLHVSRGQMGREAFLAEQNQHFDKYDANPPPAIQEVFICVLFAASFFGVYELMTYGFNLLIKRTSNNPT